MKRSAFATRLDDTMDPAKPLMKDKLTVHWPEPAHMRLEASEVLPEPCEIQFRNGATETGELLRFTGRDDHFVFRPRVGHPRHLSKIIVGLAQVKRLRLTKHIAMKPLEDGAFAQSDAVFAPSQIQVYNVEFADGEIDSGETAGYVKTQIGLFLYFRKAGELFERVFVPHGVIAYFQAGDPIGRLLVEENVVSEAQLKEAVEKQQEMRKLVLGDYLIEEGLITSEQLDAALVVQRNKPSLRLGEALIELGAVTPDALQTVLARQRANRGRPLGQILVDMGVLDPETLKKVHAKKLGLPFVSLALFKVNGEAARLVSATTARRLSIMPLAVENGELIVAVENPPDSATINELTLITRLRVVPVIALGDEIRASQREFYGMSDDDAADAAPLSDPSALRFAGVEEIEVAEPVDDEALASVDGVEFVEPVHDGITDPQVRRTLDRALDAAQSGGTLDVHVESKDGMRTTRIRYRRAT